LEELVPDPTDYLGRQAHRFPEVMHCLGWQAAINQAFGSEYMQSGVYFFTLV